MNMQFLFCFFLYQTWRNEDKMYPDRRLYFRVKTLEICKKVKFSVDIQYFHQQVQLSILFNTKI